MKRSPAEATPVRALPSEEGTRGRGNEEGCFEHLPPQRARNNPLPRPRKEQHQQLLPDYNLNQELTNSTFDGSNTSWSSSDWNAPRAPKSEPNTFYKYQGSYQAGDWSGDPSYGVMHQSSSPSASSSSYYDANNDYYGYGYGQNYGQQAPYGMQHQQQNPYPPVVRPPCDAPYNGNRIPSGCPPGKQMFPDYRRQNRFGVDAQGRIQHIKREPEDGLEQDGENFTSLFTKSLTSLYSQDAENAFPDESKTYDPDIMILDTARPHTTLDDGGYQRMNASYNMGTAGYPNHQGPRQNFGGYYENRNQIPEPAPSVVQDLNAESERVNSFRYDRPSFDDMHLYASSPNDSKSQAKKRKLSMPNIAPEGGPEGRRKGPRLASFKSDSKWTPNSFAFADVSIKQEPLDEYEDGESQNRCLMDNSSSSNGNTGKPSAPPADQPKPVVRKRSPGTTCFDRFEKKSTPASKKVSPLSVYAKVQDSIVLSVKCRRYKKRTKPIAAKEDSTYPGREEIENWKRTGAYSQSPDQAVRLLMNELIDRVSHLGDRNVSESPELPPVDINKARELLYQFCKRYSVDYSDFENAADLKPRMVVTEPTKNFERASAIRKRMNISPVRSRTPTQAEVKPQKSEKVTRRVVVEAAKSRADAAKTADKRNLRKLPGRAQRGRKLRGRSRKTPVVTRRYSTRSAKEDGHSDVDIVIDSSSDNENEAGKEAEVPKKSQRLKNKHPVVETPAKANSIDRNNSRNCVKKEDVNIRSRGRKPEREKPEEIEKLASLKKRGPRIHETEPAPAETVTGKKCQPVSPSGKDIVKTESNTLIKTSERNSNKTPPKTSSRKSADKIICDSVLSSPALNFFSRQTRKKSFDVVEIDCDDREVKPAEDKCYVKLVKHSETKPCDKPLIKKEPLSPDRKRGTSRDNSKTRLKSCDVSVDSKKFSTPKQGSLKEAKSEKYSKITPKQECDDEKQSKDSKQRNGSLDGKSHREGKKTSFQDDSPIKQENSVKQKARDRSSGESEKRQSVISKLEGRSHRKDVPKASEKKLSSAGKSIESDGDSEISSPKKNDFSRFIDKTDSVVQIKLTKLPLNFSCESSSFSESSPEDSLKVVIKNRQGRSKSKIHSSKEESNNESGSNSCEMVANFSKSKNEVLETDSNCDKADGNFRDGKEDCQSKDIRVSGHNQTSDVVIKQPEALEVPHRRKRNRSKCTDDNITDRSRITEIPNLEPKIGTPETKDSDTTAPAFDLRSTILKIKAKNRAEPSDKRKTAGRDKMDDNSPSSSEPPKLETSDVVIKQPEALEVPHRRKRNRSKCTDDNITDRSRITEIPNLEPKIGTPGTKDSDTTAPAFDLRSTILKIKAKNRAEPSDERKTAGGDKMDDNSPSSSEPPKLDCMKDSPPQIKGTNSKENQSSDPGLEETSPGSNSITCESMPSIFPVSTGEDSSRPQPITLHRRSDSDDSDCGGLVIDLDRRQSVEDRVPSPTFETDDTKPSKESETTVQREPTPSTSGYSSTSRASNKTWGLDSDEDNDCVMLESESRRPLDITFASLETAAKEHAKKIKDREESILRSLLLDNAESTPGTSQDPDQPQSGACNISPESRAKLRNDVMRIIMYQTNNEVSATTAAGGFDLKRVNSNSLPTDLKDSLLMESEEGEGADNPVDAKEKIRKLKSEIVYLQCMAEQKDQERTAIVCFQRYKEEMLRRLIKEYAFNVQDHVRDWLHATQNSDPDESRTSSGTQTSSISFATSLANDEDLDRLWNEFIVWVENRSSVSQQNAEGSAQPEFSLAQRVFQLACRTADTAASGPNAATPTGPSEPQSGEQLPAVATMVASATENYGVDIRTMRNGGASSIATLPTILQKALSSSRDEYIPALSTPIHIPSTSRSAPSTEASTSSKPIVHHHHKQSFRIYQKSSSTSTFRSRSPPLPELVPSRKEDHLQPYQKSKSSKEPPSRSPPALQPELRLPVPKIFSPQPTAPEKQYPLDLIVTTSATVTIEAAPTRCEAPIRKREKSPKVSSGSASNSQASSRRNEETPSAEAEILKSETSFSKSDNSYKKPDPQYPRYESHFETSVTKTETTYRKINTSSLSSRDPSSVSGLLLRDPASVSGLTLRDPPSVSGLPLRDSASGSGLTLRDPPSVSGLPLRDSASGSGLTLRDPPSVSGLPLRDSASGSGLTLRDPPSVSGLPLRDSASGSGLTLRDPPSVSGLPLRDPASGSGLPIRDSASGSSLPPRNPSNGEFTAENRFTAQSETSIKKSDFSFVKSENNSSTCSKPAGSYAKSESPFSKSESPFTKPGPSSKPLEAATASSFKEGSKNRRVTSSPKRRPGYSYSAWNNNRSPEASATLDLRTENARAKDDTLQPKTEPSSNGHSPSRQKFMVVPPPTTLQQSQKPSSPSSSSSSHQSRSHSSHHHETSHKSSIERIYSRSTEEELRSMSYSSIVETHGYGYPNGLAYPLVKITLSVPGAASGVKCLGCGVSDAKFLCSGCRKHWYCSAHCQTMRWPEHARECGRFYQ